MTIEPEPPKYCLKCSRLAEFRQQNQQKYPDFFNGAVPSFGSDDARLLVVGLAPGLKGANCTGRPFTGDAAGDILYAALLNFGFASGNYQAKPDDGLTLIDTMITNAVRCVPPQNKPLGGEATQCRPYLDARMASLKKLKIVLALGKIAHDNVIRAHNLRLAEHVFKHGARHPLTKHTILIDSYHCSRYNINTRRLTEPMFHKVFEKISAVLDNDKA